MKHRLNALLTEKGFTCHDEVECVDEDGSNRRIDILAIDPGDANKAYIIDPTVRYETNDDLDTIVQIEKARIYEPCIEDVKRRYPQYAQRDFEVIGLWFGSRGSIGKGVKNFFKKFKLEKKHIPDIAETVLADSINILHNHIYSNHTP